MPATIHDLGRAGIVRRARTRPLVDAYQLLLELDENPPEVRLHLESRLVALRAEPEEPTWKYAMLSDDFMVKLDLISQAHPDLKNTGLRVFLRMTPYMEKGTGRILITQQALADALGIGRAEVTKALSAFVAHNVLRRFEKVGRRTVYAMNPDIAWRGHLTAREVAVERWERPELERRHLELVPKQP